MNPYIIIAALVALIGTWFGGQATGHRAGVAEQQAADQVRFDKVNQALTDQKTEANAAYRAIQEHNLALVVERDKLKSDLEKEHAKNAAATDAVRRDLAAASLRYAAAEATRPGGCSLGAGSAGSGATSPDEPAAVELPAPITSDLRQLVFEADQLADAYRECYGYAMRVQ